MRSSVLAFALLAVAACDPSVTGELRLSNSVSTDTAVASVMLFEYDPYEADKPADVIATFTMPVQRGVQAVPFTLDPADSDSGLSHYIAANVDLDADGQDEIGDYVTTDFNKVDLGAERVIILMTQRMP